ncbi:ATP-binding protein [Campylobacter upsaliensis]|uniref:AAA family ATPase n=1 Tax=Campylobacter upsaliensis TaxID=28080 RepID=UPI000E1ADD08|nr:ATP-binding protein [Campylobacter upsaliensis]EAH9843222.1 ATP-binding protein [Campylobacter upsaliensis]EAI4344880.1 ATP-binding protein [Campylobacter upsaliensis]EAJ0886811.1 ATP-binding protein [Campylobacter upsaliensis]EAJ7019272.1 ATP-binding protein [Campylobacter upsaliensis]EAK1468019.1 ATP-binding protein [Campylobacter upsaliensis]
MLELKEFLNEPKIEKTKLYQRLQCSKNEALILKELCKSYVCASASVSAFSLLVGLFGEKDYVYLDYLEDLKGLIKRGFVTSGSGFFKNIDSNKLSNSKLVLLQSELSLSQYFLDFIDSKTSFKVPKIKAYGAYLEYLRDEFLKVELYEKLSFARHSEYYAVLKSHIKEFEKYIKECLKLSKFHNVLNAIFKEHALNAKEQILFLALLKEEYTLSHENSAAREQNALLNLISENELELRQNKKLLEDDSKLLNLIEYDEYLNAFGELSKSFFISDEVLERVINSPTKQNQKLKLESLVKEQEIFELIEPNIDINDIIMPENTKELLSNILKQKDKKVLERLSLWGIKSSKNIEAKIIFYGPPGTGKTMSAFGVAKAMKKAVLSFDCSKILSKWVGESEQNVRKIFDTYKNIANSCKQSPILLLNEADQFLSTRIEGGSGSDKMHNQMQNIFLEQIERFSGVLIATTNFLESLDSAFSRRFDLKIEFKKPDFKDRLKMWEKFLPQNADFEEAFELETLAKYELSGAQILMVVKNTALKTAISKDGIFTMRAFLESIQKELEGSFDKSKIVGF